MTTPDYTPRQESVSVRPIGKFGKPNPEAYLGNGAIEPAKENHPGNQKPRRTYDPVEMVNLFRLIMLFVGAIFASVGFGLWLAPAIGITVFGILLWIMGAWFIGKATPDNSESN